MEKLSEQQQKSVFQIIEELEANGSTLLAGHWAGAGKIAYMSTFHPEITDFIKERQDQQERDREEAKMKLLSLGIKPTEKIIDGYIAEKYSPEIDIDLGGGVALNLIRVKRRNDTIHSIIDNHIEEAPPVVINEGSLHPVGLGIDVSWIIRDEQLHAERLQSVMSNPYSMIGMSVQSMHSLLPEPEKLSPKERKKQYREGLQKMVKKGRKW